MGRGLDDTKNKLGVDMMDDGTKKELFKKFTEHGGKVIDDSAARRQQEAGARSAAREGAVSGKTPGKGQEKKPADPKKTGKDKPGVGARIGLLVGRMKLYLRSVFQNVMESSGNSFSPKFFELLQNEATNKLLDLNLLLTPLVHAPHELKTKLQAGLTRLSSHYYELLLRMNQLYDEKNFRDILLRHTQAPGAKVPPRSVEEPLRELYKRLYVLRHYSQGCVASLTKGLEIQAETEDKDKVALKRNLSRARKDLDFVFSTLFPKLHLAICNLLRENCQIEDRTVKDYLGIQDKDEVGYLSDQMVKELRDAEKQHKKVLEETKEKLSVESKEIRVGELLDSVRAGLDLMRRLPISKERVITEQDSPLRLLPQDSKSYLTLLLFREMEREYVFLLTSNQIKYSIQYHEGIKIDIKQQLGDQSIEFDQIHAMIEEFNKTLVEKTDIERSTHSVTRKNQLLHNITIKYSKLAKQIRQRFEQFCTNVEKITRRVLTDLNANGQLLQNPDDEIISDLNIGDTKKLEGRTVRECLETLNSFTSAMRYRLADGDLSGLGETIDMVYSFDEARTGEADGEDAG